MSDQEARDAILQAFYDEYLQGGLHIVVNAHAVAGSLKLDEAQARRCFDYLADSGYLKAMTLGGGYSPTVKLVDAIEAKGARR